MSHLFLSRTLQDQFSLKCQQVVSVVPKNCERACASTHGSQTAKVARSGKQSPDESCFRINGFKRFKSFKRQPHISRTFHKASRCSKRFQEHVSRALEGMDISKSFSVRPTNFKIIDAFQVNWSFKDFQEMATHFKRISRDGKISKSIVMFLG